MPGRIGHNGVRSECGKRVLNKQKVGADKSGKSANELEIVFSG